MKRFLRSQLEQRAPTVFNAIRSIRNRRYFHRKFSQFQSDFRKMLFPDGAEITVQLGPFRGMRYFEKTVWGSITPKWLGSYEAELHAVLKNIVEHPYETIIDVGCAEGYYAIGLAVAMPRAKVFAFDTDFISRAQAGRLAALNDVTDRLQIRTFCSHSELDALSKGETLVVCDIEGFEAQLLDPEKAESLLRDDVLVEVHEASDSSLTVEEVLRSRFATSHTVDRITAYSRDSWINENHQWLPATISFEALQNATEENRTRGNVWLWMQAKRSAAG